MTYILQKKIVKILKDKKTKTKNCSRLKETKGIWQVISICDPGLAFGPVRKNIFLLKTVEEKNKKIILGKLV